MWGMTAEVEKASWWTGSRKATAIIWGVLALVVATLAVVAVVQQQREDREREDRIYCTLEGVSPLDPRCTD